MNKSNWGHYVLIGSFTVACICMGINASNMYKFKTRHDAEINALTRKSLELEMRLSSTKDRLKVLEMDDSRFKEIDGTVLHIGNGSTTKPQLTLELDIKDDVFGNGATYGKLHTVVELKKINGKWCCGTVDYNMVPGLNKLPCEEKDT